MVNFLRGRQVGIQISSKLSCLPSLNIYSNKDIGYGLSPPLGIPVKIAIRAGTPPFDTKRPLWTREGYGSMNTPMSFQYNTDYYKFLFLSNAAVVTVKNSN